MAAEPESGAAPRGSVALPFRVRLVAAAVSRASMLACRPISEPDPCTFSGGTRAASGRRSRRPAAL
jgi:hypothetical protein